MNIVGDLCNYYDVMSGAGNPSFPPYGWSLARVRAKLRLDRDGRLLCVELCDEVMTVPFHAARASGVEPYLLCDNKTYLFGRDQKRGAVKRDASRRLHHDVLARLDVPQAKMARSFFEQDIELSPETIDVIDKMPRTWMLTLWDDATDSAIFSTPAVANAWDSFKASLGNGLVRCIITGKPGVPAVKFPSLMGLPGGPPTGCVLSSYNFEAACSYGKSSADKLANAQMTEETVFKSHAVLSYLVNSERNCTALAGGVLVWWTETGRAEDEAAVAWAVGAGKLYYGKQNSKPDPSARWEVCWLLANKARLSVRYVARGSIGTLLSNVHEHTLNSSIGRQQRNSAAAPTPEAMLINASPSGKYRDIPSVLVPHVLAYVIEGRKPPELLMTAITSRSAKDACIYKGEKDVMAHRAAIVRGCLIRSRDSLVAKSLDASERSVPYALGRAMAVTDYATNLARNKLGPSTSVFEGRKDNVGLFVMMMGSPAEAFPIMCQKLIQAIGACRTLPMLVPLSVMADRAMADAVSKVDAVPQTLNPDEKAMFLVGYQHQAEELYRPKGQP